MEPTVPRIEARRTSDNSIRKPRLSVCGPANVACVAAFLVSAIALTTGCDDVTAALGIGSKSAPSDSSSAVPSAGSAAANHSGPSAPAHGPGATTPGGGVSNTQGSNTQGSNANKPSANSVDGGLSNSSTGADPTSSNGPIPLGPGARLEDERNTIDVFRLAAPATVFVVQKRIVRTWSMQAAEVPAGSGTGFVWDKKGHVVTNYHVIDGDRSTTLSVMLYGRKSYDAVLVGGERDKDLAVLRINAPTDELTPIRLPDTTNKLEVGQKAIAIGNPFGLDHTLTTGIVSAIGRDISGYGGVTIRDMIQTDASINPGNSGGPLLDSGGNLIGVNTMIYSKSGTSAGIGFAVPVSVVRRIVPQIIEFGHAKRAGIGIRVLSDQYAARAGLRGVIVGEVLPGSPAEKAGMRGVQRVPSGAIMLGDVIVGIADHEVKDYDGLYTELDRYAADDVVVVKVLRDGKVIELEVALADLG
ncbi:MAG: trypsin-like peptidase domain-containing protein [Polyangiaceae bacterium]|nr:trypsin-like peptidase domain-containing protein [Polyangiaceae bacterium]